MAEIEVGTVIIKQTKNKIVVASRGVQGPPGPPGSATGYGQPRFTGNGPPGVIIGASPGDQYLDRDSGLIYELH